ncbi:MAG: hypothetical protein DRG78_14295 [Epsilonproteobacteria bacterium]|nr:MAG: hypothetical protein DRG78_14295 [Campylobacterota bacterium]
MKYTKLKFKSSSTKPHDFIGSKIRGVLGYALKEEVCINPSFKCENCFALKDCIFYKFYEQKNITHKYRLDFELRSDKFEFAFLLFGDAIKHKDEIKTALLKSLKEYQDVVCEEESLIFASNDYSSIVKLEFLTPLRMKKDNKFVKDSIDLIDILVSINRRYYELTGEDFERLNVSKDYNIITKHLNYKELTRKSNTQKTKMNLGGVMGDMVITNIDKKSYELLKLGEIIGVGKSTVFGLGKIRVEGFNG